MAYSIENIELWQDWSECTIDDAKAIAALMGWDIDRVYFSGFWSQGDGACFEGSFGYAKGCAAAVRAYAPQDSTLHAIAERWQALQKQCFYQLAGTVRHSGHYYHEMSTSFDWEDARDSWRALPLGVDDEASDIARDFMRWIYRKLEREYEFQFAWEVARVWDESRDEMKAARIEARKLVGDIRALVSSGVAIGDSACRALRQQVRSYLTEWEEARETRDNMAEGFHYWQDGKAIEIEAFASEYI